MNRTKLDPALWISLMGLALLFYAVIGNYVALPGYIRFLERGGKSAAGGSFDVSVVVGAIKTIVWMYSFQLGVLALAIAKSIREKLHTKHLVVLSLLWLTAWSARRARTVVLHRLRRRGARLHRGNAHSGSGERDEQAR